MSRNKQDEPPVAIVTGASTGIGYELARCCAHGDVVTGWHNKLQSAIANITPAAMLAEQTRKQYQLAKKRSAS